MKNATYIVTSGFFAQVADTPEKTPPSRGAHSSQPVIVHDLVAVDDHPVSP